jgi:hypothetical protein
MVDALLEEVAIWEKEEADKEGMPAVTNGNNDSDKQERKFQLPVVG